METSRPIRSISTDFFGSDDPSLDEHHDRCLRSRKSGDGGTVELGVRHGPLDGDARECRRAASYDGYCVSSCASLGVLYLRHPGKMSVDDDQSFPIPDTTSAEEVTVEVVTSGRYNQPQHALRAFQHQSGRVRLRRMGDPRRRDPEELLVRHPAYERHLWTDVFTFDGFFTNSNRLRLATWMLRSASSPSAPPVARAAAACEAQPFAWSATLGVNHSSAWVGYCGSSCPISGPGTHGTLADDDGERRHLQRTPRNGGSDGSRT